jgi:hypothetical protein
MKRLILLSIFLFANWGMDVMLWAMGTGWAAHNGIFYITTWEQKSLVFHSAWGLSILSFLTAIYFLHKEIEGRKKK